MSSMTIQKISERSGTRIKLPEAKGDKYKVRLMGWDPGSDVVEGSSADYPVEAIKRDFAEAFPKGTRMRANHDGFCEAGGDVRRIMAKTVDTPWAEADGMYAHMVVPNKEHAEFIENFGDAIGLSISAGCELQYEAATDDDGEPILDHDDQPVLVPVKSERGAYVVKRFLSQEESPYNTVDFVEAPGADGRIVALAIESARDIVEHFTAREAATFARGTIKTAVEAAENSEATPPRSNEEEDMTEEERKALVAEAALAGATTALEAFRSAESAPEQPTLGAMVEAITAAGLTEEGRAGVYERVELGQPLEAAIEAESAREAKIREQLGAATPTAEADEVQPFGYTVGEGDKSLSFDADEAASTADFTREYEEMVKHG